MEGLADADGNLHPVLQAFRDHDGFQCGYCTPGSAALGGDLDVSFIDEFDEAASLIGAKGIGELGATGVDAAVAAAVHDAVGVRVRDLPILPWKVLEG